MSLLIALLIGIIVGVGVAFILPRNPDLIALNIMAGIVGALIGLAIYFFSSYDTIDGTSLFSGFGTLASLLGALTVVLLFNFIHRIFPSHIPHEGHSANDSNDED